MSNQDQNRDRRNHRKHAHGHQGHKKGEPQVYSKGEVMTVTWVEQKLEGGGTKVLSYTREGTPIYPGSRMYRPKAGSEHECSVKFYENERGKKGLAMPTLPYSLPPDEFLDIKEAESVMKVTLVFQRRKGKDGLIAWLDGLAIFPDNGTTVQAGKPTPCIIREKGTVGFALPLPQIQGGQGGTGLVKLEGKIAEFLGQRYAMAHVVISKAEQREGFTGRPQTEADIVIKKEHRNVYGLLTYVGPDENGREIKVVVSESSSEDEINKAFRVKSKMTHPDKIYVAFGGEDKTPLITRKNAVFIFEALKEAKDRALELIKLRQGDAEKRPQGAPSAGPDQGRKDKRDRKRREDRRPAEAKPAVTDQSSEAPKAKEETASAPADKVEAPVVEAQAEAAPVPEASAPVVETVAEPPVEAQAETAPETEAASVTDGEADEVDPLVKGLSEELHEPIEVIEAVLKIAKKTPEEFAGLGENIQKFYLKQARGQVKAAKATSAGKSGSKVEAKAKTEPKGEQPKGFAALAARKA